LERKMVRRRHQAGVPSANPSEQEVVRANRVLSAYFKGQRTEREALAALKIIKGFIKDRERMEPSKRPHLPGVKQPRPRSTSPARPPRASTPSAHREDRSDE
jgi:hypothetical protein